MVQQMPDSSHMARDDLKRFSSVLFELGKSNINDVALKQIGVVRDYLVSHPASGLLLLAHTDTTGSASTNGDLSKQRGDAVRELLVQGGAVSPARIFVADLPKTDLPELTRGQVKSQKNRSVEMIAFPLSSQANARQ